MVDAYERITGTIEYTQNLSLPGMLHGRTLRSPHPHARILRIDASRALAAPGVVAVLTGQDLVDDPALDPWFGPFIKDRAPLAIGKVRYVGDPVALLAAETDDQARDAVDLIDVEYEVLPAVLDIDAALAPGAPIIHEGPRVLESHRADIVARQPGLADTNLIHTYFLRKGDIESGFAEAEVIVEQEYRTPGVAHVPFETHNAVAAWSGNRVTIWSSCQAPSSCGAYVAGILGLPVSDVRVIVPTLGGGYGGKIDPMVEPIAAIMARKTRRPVRVTLARSEEFLSAGKHPSKIRIKSGVKRDGTLVAHQSDVWYDGGCYALNTPEKIFRGYATTGPYRVPNVFVDAYGVYTNSLPYSAFRGYGIAQVMWAAEQQMDQIAEVLGMDPLELRRKNILHEGEVFSTGETIREDMHYDELLDDAAKRIGWAWPPKPERNGSRVRGRGLSAIIKGTSSYPGTAGVKLNADGSLNIQCSTVEMGQGSLTVLAQIGAHEATLPLSAVRVSTPDTWNTPFDQMTAASRSTNFMGRAIRKAVQEVKVKLLELAAGQLEAATGDLDIADGRVFVKGSPERGLTFAQVVSTAKVGSLMGSGRADVSVHFDVETGQGVASPQWHPAICGADVDVDEDTGKVTINRLHLGLYLGRMINPTHIDLQVLGASLFGVGQVLFEELVWDEGGALTNPNLSDYMIPSFLDVPPQFTQTILETPNSIEVHGIGETSLPAIAPAVANAVSQALGIRVTSLPLTPERVLRLIRERDEARGAATGNGNARIHEEVAG
jgi:CO/xanthine dehydrogenase Mo-binding subunit